jgi:hypothetical protein
MTSHARLPGFRQAQRPQAVQQPPWPQDMSPDTGAAPWPPAQAPAAPAPTGPATARAEPRQHGSRRRRNGQARRAKLPGPPAAAESSAGGPPAGRTSAGRPRGERRRGERPRAAKRLDDKTAGPVYIAVLACAGGGMLLAWLSAGGVRWGAVLAGGGLVAAALARLALPARLSGMLAARHRYLDASTLAVLGLGMAVIGLLLPPPT